MMDSSRSSERLVNASGFAAILGVAEDDVLEWMLEGYIPYVEGPDGAPRVRVREVRGAEGPMSFWEMDYSISTEPGFRAELARRSREHELAGLDWGSVDIEALTDAIVIRLKAAVASKVRVVVDGSMIWLRDTDGTGVGVDVADSASLPENGTSADRVCAAAASALQATQDELTMVTTEPWPRHGAGDLPDPHAELTPDGENVRLFYGDSASPILELEALRIADVLDKPPRD